jgi:hypothetical protein
MWIRPTTKITQLVRSHEFGFSASSVPFLQDEPGFVSQTGYLGTYALACSPEFRFLASQYPKDHLDKNYFAKPREVPLNITIWPGFDRKRV